MTPSTVNTRENQRRIISLRARGWTFQQIAEAIGCSASTVFSIIESIREAVGAPTSARRSSAAETAQAEAVSPAPKPAPASAPSPQQAGRRKCLGGCGQMFNSSSAANRICYRCQPRRAGVNPFTPDAI